MSKPKLVKGCEECGFAGYLLINAPPKPVHIERCDACESFQGDSVATKYVFDLANRYLDTIKRRKS